MAITQKQRWVLLTGALVLTLAAVAWVSQTGQEPVAQVELPRPAARHAAPRPGGQAAIRLDKLKRTPLEGEVADLFKSKTWYVPPPPPKPAPPPPPSAPPLPFTYMGKLLEDGKVTVFLARQDRNYLAREGDTIDGTYRVDEIRAPLMTLTYLPLNIKQTLQIGETK